MAVPFDQLDGFIWMNGSFVAWADARIHVLTHGLHYASAVFEGERAYGGEIFKLTEHTERLHESARILGFRIPYSVSEIDEACRQLLKKQGFLDAYVRPVAWRGSDSLGVSAQNNKINTAIAIWQWPSYFDPAQKLKGIRLDIAEYRRPDPMTAPSRAKAAGLTTARWRMPAHHTQAEVVAAVSSAHTADEIEAAAEKARAELATKEKPLSDD